MTIKKLFYLMVSSKVHIFIVCILLTCSQNAFSAELRIAVASNFITPMKALAKNYEHKTGNKVIIISSSTGKLYAQIINGAPYDAFFSADKERPEQLEKDKLIIPGSRFTYALGKIVLWSPKSNYIDNDGLALVNKNFDHLSIANPKLAPYGKAAYEVLKNKGLWDKLKIKMVRGENIGQTYQFVKSGNATMGFVALSQILSPQNNNEGSYWNIPQSLYNPIEQQAVQLNSKPAVSNFLSFVKSDSSLKLIQNFGYGVHFAQ